MDLQWSFEWSGTYSESLSRIVSNNLTPSISKIKIKSFAIFPLNSSFLLLENTGWPLSVINAMHLFSNVIIWNKIRKKFTKLQRCNVGEYIPKNVKLSKAVPEFKRRLRKHLIPWDCAACCF